jgi:chemotaxis protein methyltransferase CheR
VLQDGWVERLESSHTIKADVRVIAATNRHLEQEVRKRRFREDLWYRLNIFPITVPLLRERSEDIPLLVEYFVGIGSKRMGSAIESIPTTLMNALQDYHWPVNIRALENVLDRAVINSSGPKLRLVDELKRPNKALSQADRALADVERGTLFGCSSRPTGKRAVKTAQPRSLVLTAVDYAPACESLVSKNRSFLSHSD